MYNTHCFNNGTITTRRSHVTALIIIYTLCCATAAAVAAVQPGTERHIHMKMSGERVVRGTTTTAKKIILVKSIEVNGEDDERDGRSQNQLKQ